VPVWPAPRAVNMRPAFVSWVVTSRSA